MGPVRAMPSKGVNGSRPSRNLAPVHDSPRDHILVSCPERNALALDRQYLALTMHNAFDQRSQTRDFC